MIEDIIEGVIETAAEVLEAVITHKVSRRKKDVH